MRNLKHSVDIVFPRFNAIEVARKVLTVRGKITSIQILVCLSMSSKFHETQKILRFKDIYLEFRNTLDTCLVEGFTIEQRRHQNLTLLLKCLFSIFVRHDHN